MSTSIVFFVCGAVGVVAGIAMLLNIFGAADRAAAQNVRNRHRPTWEGTAPETRGGMRVWGLVATVAGAAAIAAGLDEQSADANVVSCAYAGGSTRVLTVTVEDGSVGEIVRRGTQIVAGGQDEPPAECSGGAPTVRNTDTIRIVLVDVAFVDVDLSGGAFAPGATREGEGAAEIEIELSPGLGAAYIIGSAGDDEWHWRAGEANPELNLNPRVAGDRDSDVTVVGREEEAGPLVASGGGGDDTIIGAPGALLRGDIIVFGDAGNDRLIAPVIAGPVEYGAELHGGPGNDTITGGGHDDEITGDAGDDNIDGQAGADKITAGPGRDDVSGGAGRDTINSRDTATDAVSCGAGHDRATADALDRVRGCETLATR